MSFTMYAPSFRLVKEEWRLRILIYSWEECPHALIWS